MIVIMKQDATKEDIDFCISKIQEWGGNKVSQAPGERQMVLGIVGDKSQLIGKPLSTLPGVEKVVEVSAPYKLASREFHPQDSAFDIGGVKVGGGHKCIIAGPCSIDTYEYAMETAIAVKKAGATMYRGGAFKPRTSPYAFQGSGEEGLKIMEAVKKETGMPIVTELMSEKDIDLVYRYADVIQIGARNMQNFSLLKEIGKLGKAVLLKNGIASTAQEHLMSVEYVMSGGLNEVMLCLRGVRSYETAMRNTLDVALVPYLQRKTHLPIIIDPSHSAGKREFVSALGFAGMAAGADGMIVEVHPNPSCALSDGEQALLPRDFDYMMDKINSLKPWSQKAWAEFDKQNKTK